MSDLIISISGVRGIVGGSLDPAVAVRFGQAFSTLLGGGTVAVGRDTRPSGDMIRSAVVAGLLAGGTRVIDLGIATTPATALMTRRMNCDGGVVVTASHNPVEWNGLKFLRPAGAALSAETGARLRTLYESGPFRTVPAVDIPAIKQDHRDICGWGYERMMPLEDIFPLLPDRRAAGEHVRAVLELTDQKAVSARRFKVVLDSVNGAGSIEGPMLLSELGCVPIAIAGTPDGRFPHPPEPTEANLTGLCAAVRLHKADVGFAQDPDADRLAIVDETGRYIGEEYTLALAARYVLERRPGPLAANLSTSRMIDLIAAKHGVPVHRTPVGEAHVADAVEKSGCVLGGEGNGGVIDPRIVPVRDSLTGMAMVLQLMADTLRPLSVLVDELPRLHMVKTKFECAPDRAARILAALKTRHAGRPMNDSDGLRIEFDEAWVHVRPSNTEPIFRVIGEAPTAAAARELCSRIEAEALGA
jgi:phosphomannomutase